MGSNLWSRPHSDKNWNSSPYSSPFCVLPGNLRNENKTNLRRLCRNVVCPTPATAVTEKDSLMNSVCVSLESISQKESTKGGVGSGTTSLPNKFYLLKYL